MHLPALVEVAPLLKHPMYPLFCTMHWPNAMNSGASTCFGGGSTFTGASYLPVFCYHCPKQCVLPHLFATNKFQETCFTMSHLG